MKNEDLIIDDKLYYFNEIEEDAIVLELPLINEIIKTTILNDSNNYINYVWYVRETFLEDSSTYHKFYYSINGDTYRCLKLKRV